jgi:hypothetical protein
VAKNEGQNGSFNDQNGYIIQPFPKFTNIGHSIQKHSQKGAGGSIKKWSQNRQNLSKEHPTNMCFFASISDPVFS